MMVSSNAFLNADGQRYKIKSFGTEPDSAGFKLDKPFKIPADGIMDLTLRFEPFGKDVERFDFIDTIGRLLIKGIYDEGKIPLELTDTYWRNVETGDWEIGFTDDYVIYDNRIWKIDEQDEQDDIYRIAMKCDSQTLNVVVDARKNGARTIQIGDAKQITCQVITTATLPDYPQKDTRKGFVDTGYQMGDSVTVIGWLKDMTLLERSISGNSFEIIVNPFVQECDDESQCVYTASINSKGFFSIKFPLANTTHAALDWSRSRVQLYLEPGKTYFFLNDFSTGKKLFMGDDVRVQNEILSHPLVFYRNSLDHNKTYSNEEILQFVESIDKEHASIRNHLKTIIESRPNLSQRFIDFYELDCLVSKWHKICQLRFHIKDVTVFKDILSRAEDEVWNKVQPYTLHRDYSLFVRDFAELRMKLINNHVVRAVSVEAMLAADDSGRIKIDKEVRDAMESMQRRVALLDTMSEEVCRIVVDSINTSDEMKLVNEYLNRESLKVIAETEYYYRMQCFKGLHYTKTFSDLFLAKHLCSIIDYSRLPLNPVLIEQVENDMQSEYAKNAVKTFNDKYLNLGEKKSPKELKEADAVAEMSDGEKIFRKLIEPYKGKFILVDVWGVWCGPCRMALSESNKLYERLKEYDIVYMYFANNSSEQACKNVINEYNVKGDNVVHYNLPREQQNELENYLKVSSYPSYRLVDRDGELLNVNANPLYIDAFERMLKELHDK